MKVDQWKKTDPNSHHFFRPIVAKNPSTDISGFSNEYEQQRQHFMVSRTVRETSIQ